MSHRPSRTLVVGDALTVAGGDLKGPEPEQTLDPQLAKQSLGKLAKFDIEADSIRVMPAGESQSWRVDSGLGLDIVRGRTGALGKCRSGPSGRFLRKL